MVSKCKKWILVFASYSALWATASLGVEFKQTVPEILKQMTGCFKVSFNYVEDGTHDFVASTFEKASLILENPLTIKREFIIKKKAHPHWSEEWTPVDADANKWRQTVRGPAGDFRYVCEGAWVNNQWSCWTDHAEKPVRDADRPYSHLERSNTLQINANRWVHAQTNKKITTEGDLYSIEVGWNLYEKVSDEECETH